MRTTLARQESAVALHELRETLEYAEAGLAFLGNQGFEQTVCRMIGTGSSFKDGWALQYSSPSVTVTVLYTDMELEITFQNDGTKATYLFLDEALFGRAGGLHGNMFQLKTLPSALNVVCKDIESHYALILAGDDAVWSTILSLSKTPPPVRRLPL